MQIEFASHMSAVQSLCAKLDLLTGEMRELQKLHKKFVQEIQIS